MDFHDPAKLAKQMGIALDERYNNPTGTVFHLRKRYYDNEVYFNCQNPYFQNLFTNFDAAIRFINEQEIMQFGDDDDLQYISFSIRRKRRKYGEVENCNCVSFSIEKYIPGENGELDEYCIWILSCFGEILYFDYLNREKYIPEGWDSLLAYPSVNIPVPFELGDIILADSRPFAKESHVLITVNKKFVCIWIIELIYILPNGKIGIESNWDRINFSEDSYVSTLYRASIYKGELTESEKPLGIIRAALRAGSISVSDICNYINENAWRNKDDDNDYSGVTWEQLKNEFKL